MESPVVLEKPPEYHGKRDERGFPFDEEESGAWSSLAARHPDIAARLRQRPATWARKRRPSSQDASDGDITKKRLLFPDFGDAFGFDRFPFDDIPPEFRDSFPSHWARRFEEPQAQQPQPQQPQPPQPQTQQPQTQPAPAPAPASPQPQQSSAATQTEAEPAPHLPQYGLRNTVDLGQKSAADPSVDADERAQRSMSAPPPSMSAHEQPEPAPAQQPQQPQHPGTVRHIPIFVEGRDEPVINKNVDHGAHFGDTKPHHAPPPPPPHVDRDQYFADDSPAFHHPPNFSRAFGTPFNKGFRQGPQPFTQQKAYPQNAYRGASPQRSQSPKRPPQEEQFAKTHHPQQQAPPPQQHQHHPPQQHHPQHQHPQQQQQQQQPPPQQPHAPSPPPRQQPTPNDPITVILAIQTDVLNLMSDVENFTGAKNDKRYLYLDEMLTRNLIKLDNIETDGKENIRQARKEAIKCIQKCIAVLEAKAESNANRAAAPAPAQDVDMQASAAGDRANGEVDMKDTKEEAKADTQESDEQEQKPQEPQQEEAKQEASQEVPPPDTRPETRAVLVEKKEQDADKKSPKKKVGKKRDKSKDNTPKDTEVKEEKSESMQVDEKGDQDSQKMDVDGAAASQ